ncbi:MAG TPA: hypothetical protein ENK05_04020 [Gammaproteobacteria bacterium]|nr:hypothetical protein [Gammaproteobacteria bacterium]
MPGTGPMGGGALALFLLAAFLAGAFFTAAFFLATAFFFATFLAAAFFGATAFFLATAFFFATVFFEVLVFAAFFLAAMQLLPTGKIKNSRALYQNPCRRASTTARAQASALVSGCGPPESRPGGTGLP